MVQVFKRDCNYVIHLQLQHRGEDQETIEELVSDIHHFKLDGCEFTCAICGGKYVQHSSFMRHTKNHGITYKEYQGKVKNKCHWLMDDDKSSYLQMFMAVRRHPRAVSSVVCV